MKRLLFGVVLACAAVIGFAATHPMTSKADVTTGYPYSYTLASELNAIGASLTVYGVQNASVCRVVSYGTTYVGTADIYTSILGTFSDAVKVGQFTGPGVQFITIASTSPSVKPSVAIRVQIRAFTSGDPLFGIDCKGGLIATGAVVQPTPSATP